MLRPRQDFPTPLCRLFAPLALVHASNHYLFALMVLSVVVAYIYG